MAGGRRKEAAPCRAALLGERKHFFMLPRCVVDSVAYRSLSLHARAVLIEIGVRLDGFNNGAITVSQRELVDALGCSPNRTPPAIAELVDRGLLQVTVEGTYRARQARQYRLTFVSTKAGPATNDYVGWTPPEKKSGDTASVAGVGCPATASVATGTNPATASVASRVEEWRKSVDRAKAPATASVAHISKPCPPAPAGQRRGDDGSYSEPPFSAGNRCDDETETRRQCEQCGGGFALERADRAAPRRFCSETCRRRAEKARARERAKHQSEPTPIGSIMNGTVARLAAGGRA